MCHFEKKNSKIFSPERPRKNVWGPRKNVSPGPAMALDGPALDCSKAEPTSTIKAKAQLNKNCTQFACNFFQFCFSSILVLLHMLAPSNTAYCCSAISDSKLLTRQCNYMTTTCTMNSDESGCWNISDIVAGCACVRAFVGFVHCPKPDHSSHCIDLHTITTFHHVTILQQVDLKLMHRPKV